MKVKAAKAFSTNLMQRIVFCEKKKPVDTGVYEFNILAKQVMDAGNFDADEGDVLPLITGDQVCILVGAGNDAKSLSHRQIAVGIQTALQTNPITPKKPVGIQLAADTPGAVRAAVDGVKLGMYQWNKYIKKTDKTVDYEKLDVSIATELSNDVKTASLIADGVKRARDLGNENSDVADSVFLEKTVRSIIKGNKACKMTVLNKKQLKDKGMGLHLAVNQGSHKEPKLIIVKYSGGKKDESYQALVGKGITFDTGGLNLKPTGSIEDMRMDMCGAATVIGTLQNAVNLKLKKNVLFVVGCAENAVSSYSYKPGDVFRGYSGMTVEILNTDAEGRLVLADANSYIARNYKPESIINIATLTGAVVIALGNEYTGLMSSDHELAQSLLTASKVSDDRAWELPIYDELKEHVKSEIADIKNIGIKRCAGSISAGEFLRQFVHCESKDIKWAHLDIAGTSKPDSKHGYFDTNATGAGVRLLTHFLLG